MPTKLKSKLVGALLAVTLLLALPAAAQATLTYVKGSLSPVVYTANDNGSGVKKVGKGSNPHVTPDGKSIIYLHEGPGHSEEMKLAPVGGGAGKTILGGWREPFNLAISPDSGTVAALQGPELGKRRLALVDLETGEQENIASGFFNGFSFSPDSYELAFGKANSENFPQKTDVYRYSILSGKTARLTTDKKSQNPLWGPSDEIVFVKQLDANKRQYGPKNELYLMNSKGKGVKRLTRTNVAPLLLGLIPTAWSANGKKLLAEFVGQDTSYAVAVNPQTGGQKPLEKNPSEIGFVGTAISGDGSTVLGYVGGFEGGGKQDVVSIPYGGGRQKLLAKGGYEPDWNR